MNETPLPLGKYKTRDGRDAEVLAHIGTPTEPKLLGFVTADGYRKDGRLWYPTGRVLSGGVREHATDLVPPTKRRAYEPNEIPVGALIRHPDSPDSVSTVFARRTNVVMFHLDGQVAQYAAETLFSTGWEVSLDLGKTWSFFGKEITA